MFALSPLLSRRHLPAHAVPKTEQVTVYRTGDDGDQQRGWWGPRSVSTNRTRYKLFTAGGENLVLDHATGLIWPRAWDGAGANSRNPGTWDTAIDWAVALDFAGFTDWRLPNVKEIASLVDHETLGIKLDTSIFTLVREDNYWSSTTYIEGTTSALAQRFNMGYVYPYPKITATYYMVACRGM